MQNNVIYSSPDILSGTPVFKWTRVPIKNLFDYIETGETFETFLRDFPTVTKKQALEVLEMAEHLLTSEKR